jgi:predicted short-subunit dehydrogenase-like oxidoreductase (DUF2520 family)
VPRKLSISIVGPGRLGTALALSLRRAGYRISEIGVKSKSTARARYPGKVISSDQPLTADLVWFCVPDRQIATAARERAANTDWRGKIALHASGALTSDELDVLRQKGAAVAAVHPLMTFVPRSSPNLKGVPFGMEGDAKALTGARRVVRDLGGEPFLIEKTAKPAYHAWGAFASPLLIATLVTAEQVANKAGVSAPAARRKMLPILRQTIENYAKLGPAAAFSGPIIRGDAEVVRKHLQILRAIPEARQVYMALARSALKHLPAKNRKELEQLLSS